MCDKNEQFKTAMGRYDYLAPNEITVCIPKAEYEELLTYKVKAETAAAYENEMRLMDTMIDDLRKEVDGMKRSIPSINLPEVPQK